MLGIQKCGSGHTSNIQYFFFLRLEVSQYVYIYTYIYIYHYIHIISSWHYRQKLGGTCSRDFVDVTTFFFKRVRSKGPNGVSAMTKLPSGYD